MCGPAAVAIGAAALAAGGQIAQTVGEARQASYESKVAKINSRMESDRARDAIVRGEDKVRTYQQQASQERGQMIAAMASNGIDTSFGSASDVIEDQRQITAEDSLALTRNYEREAQDYRINASNWLGESAAAKSRGRGAIVAGVFKVGATALGGAQQVGKINASQKAP